MTRITWLPVLGQPMTIFVSYYWWFSVINNQTNESNISPLGRDKWSKSHSKLSSGQTGENICYGGHNVYLAVSILDSFVYCVIVQGELTVWYYYIMSIHHISSKDVQWFILGLDIGHSPIQFSIVLITQPKLGQKYYLSNYNFQSLVRVNLFVRRSFHYVWSHFLQLGQISNPGKILAESLHIWVVNYIRIKSRQYIRSPVSEAGITGRDK